MYSRCLLYAVLGMCQYLVVGEFNLTILHTNDFHARYDETNTYSSPCPKADAAARKCFGGIARLVAAVKEMRTKYPNSLLLDGGDQSQGTLWYFLFGANVTAHFANRLGYDAMAFGNHEFDRGIPEVEKFLDLVNFPVINANIDPTPEPSLVGKFNKSVVLTVQGERIAIIGYTTTETRDLSNPGALIFHDEVESVRNEVNRLKSQGINKFIAVGHSGFTMDVKIATEIADIDIVVGGHTNTFLYTGQQPSTEIPEDKYPKPVSHPDGSQALCVQDYAYGKYLGVLHVTFDDSGKILEWSGDPVLLNASHPQDQEILEDMKLFQGNLTALQTSVIGTTSVYLEGDIKICRAEECNLGNLLADAMVRKYIKYTDPGPGSWNKVAMALVNGGSIRTSIPKGNITYENVLTVQPFQNTIDIIKVTGATLLAAFEYCASRRTTGYDLFGGFLQVSGMRVTYDMSQPVNRRVKELLVTCTSCDFPRLEPVNKTGEYRIVMANFITKGGDGYTMFKDNQLEHVNLGDGDADITIDFIKRESPMVQGLERRIIFADSTPQCTSASPYLALPWCMFMSIVIALKRLFTFP